LQLRAETVNLVQDSGEDSKSVEALSAVYNYSNTKQLPKERFRAAITNSKFSEAGTPFSRPASFAVDRLKRRKVIAGYLGRNDRDEFYFL
jgi:hypothetical protein